MSLIRLLFWGIILYFGYKVFKNITNPSGKGAKVKGKPKSKPLDIDESEIEDAEFKEIKDDKKGEDN